MCIRDSFSGAVAAEEGHHDSDASPRHRPRLSESGSSLGQSLSQLKETFSESVLSVAPPQVSKPSQAKGIGINQMGPLDRVPYDETYKRPQHTPTPI